LGGLVAEKELIEGWKGLYGDLEFFKRFLDEIGVKEDLRLDKMKQGDDVRLNTLANCVLSGELYVSKEPKSMFCVTPIGNLQIALVYELVNELDEGYRYKLHSLKDVKIEITLVTEEQEVVEVPFISYVRHEKPELLGTISNLDWEHLVNEYGRLVNTQRRFYIETATLDMLAMIDQYDKTGKGELLKNAMRVQEWLAKQSKDRLSRQSMALNRLQIVRRMRPLRDEEREELAKVIAKSKHAQIKYAAYLLMGDKINAKYWYGRLKDEERKEMDGQPITRFKEF
jgi:hypothetical protein